MKTFFVWLALCCCNALLYGAVSADRTKPFFTSKELTRVEVGTAYYYRFTAMDSAGSAIRYSVRGTADWMKFDAENHSVSGRPLTAGQFPVQVIAYNGADSASQRFMVTVYDRNTVNILPLGNSITNGTSTFNSYRRSLWKLLHGARLNFDIIGSWSKHHMGGDVPDPDFDMDHEGHSGWTAANILEPPGWDSIRGNINQWLSDYTPDIVLVELGTNDVFQCRKADDVIRDLSQIIAILRVKNPRVKIFIGQVPPLGAAWSDKKLCGNEVTYYQSLMTMNGKFADLCKTINDKRSPVISVDQYTGVDPAKDMYDDIHPNNSGEDIMAERWFAAIRKYLPKLQL